MTCEGWLDNQNNGPEAKGVEPFDSQDTEDDNFSENKTGIVAIFWFSGSADFCFLPLNVFFRDSHVGLNESFSLSFERQKNE